LFTDVFSIVCIMPCSPPIIAMASALGWLEVIAEIG
jgi:hypothetical protein